ncbi:hypothetical protein 276BB001_74 [Bacillus phage 276BB001]|nr:hypothetical protein 276BB001_74 [Bacillus phage 276BB001]QFG05993.1 hypothetical protein 280BB001_74 [Bacillus phage 280BB001]QZA70142.1 hypothetical protein 274BB002_74 [Bacillus phage 274BB002]
MYEQKRLHVDIYAGEAITKDQEEAINILLEEAEGDVDSAISRVTQAHGWYSGSNLDPLNKLEQGHLIRILITGTYTVKDTFENWLEEQVNRVVDGTPVSYAYQIVLEEFKKRQEEGEF